MKSDKLLTSFQSFLENNCAASKRNNFLLAVSGGLDSVVMSDLFSKGNYSFSIAHCNFNLRGDESDTDEKFVKHLADKYKVTFFVERFDTLGKSETENISIQMAARNLRYQWFEKLGTENHFDFIATAHHKEDSTETVLLNITRGTGLEGLKGIASRNDFIIRPVLFASSEEILEYANENNLQWREDSSNASTDYQRNFIRHKIVPLLKEINPSVQDSINNLSVYTNESLLLLNETIEMYRAELCIQSGDNFIVDTKKIIHHPAKRTLLYYLLDGFNFNSSQIESLSLSTGKSGIVFYSLSHRLIINRDQLIVSVLKNTNETKEILINENDAVLHLNDHILQVNCLSNINRDDLKKGNTSVAVIDASKIKFPLTLRRWQKGDYFYPLGMNHQKKLSDYFTDEKFSIADKEKTWLVVNNTDGAGEIVWIVNHRLDHRYRVTDETKNVVQLKLINSTNING